jgi:hypothetical protein
MKQFAMPICSAFKSLTLGTLPKGTLESPSRTSAVFQYLSWFTVFMHPNLPGRLSTG